jgi:hypothetical protein
VARVELQGGLEVTLRLREIAFPREHDPDVVVRVRVARL